MISDRQLDLFGAEEPCAKRPGVDPAAAPEEDHALAARLPAGLHLGTSSWSFPGWRGIVYRDAGPPALSVQKLAREGLPAYARHPLLNAVGLDRSYYAALPRDIYARYAAAVPEGFRFVVKAEEVLTRPESPRFLDPEYAERAVIAPCLEGLGGDRAGPLLFQFPPLHLTSLGGRSAFAARLHGFVSRLPAGPVYAVEVRNRALCHREVDAALDDAGAVPCFNAHPRVPPLAEQRRARALPPVLLVRWMLHRDFRYEQAKRRYAPFDRLVDEDPGSRDAISELVRNALGSGRPAYVIANNKAEGSAPLSLRELARRIVD